MVASEASRGLRSTIFISEGRNKLGWKFVIDVLERFLLKDFGGRGSGGSSKISSPPSILGSYAEAVQRKSFELVLHRHEWEGNIELSFDTSSFALVVKDNAFDSWPSVVRGVSMRFGQDIGLRLFCDNLVVIHVVNASLRSKLLGFRRGSLGCAIHLRSWNNAVVAESRCSSFPGGWRVFMDIPPHLRSLGVVKGLASLCGGLQGEIDEVTLSASCGKVVRCNIVGKENVVILLGCFLNQGEAAFWVRFVLVKEDSVIELLPETQVMKDTTVLLGQRERSWQLLSWVVLLPFLVLF